MERLDFVKISHPQIDLYINAIPIKIPVGVSMCVYVCVCMNVGVLVYLYENWYGIVKDQEYWRLSI